MSDVNPLGLAVGDRVVVELHRRVDTGPPQPFWAAGTLVGAQPPEAPRLGYVRLDDHELGEPATGLLWMKREGAEGSPASPHPDQEERHGHED